LWLKRRQELTLTHIHTYIHSHTLTLQRCPSRLNICRCRTATENEKLLPRRRRAAMVIKKGEPRRCRDGDFENLWIFKSVTDLN
jgi:hypothetical protein